MGCGVLPLLASFSGLLLVSLGVLPLFVFFAVRGCALALAFEDRLFLALPFERIVVG